MSSKKSVSMGIGTSSLMMVFVVLCMSIFATLTFLQGNAHLKKSERYKESVVSYYELDTEASLLLEQYKDEYAKGTLDESLVSGNELHYEVTGDEHHYLSVIYDLENNKVIEWKMVSVTDDDYGNTGFDL
ncbi:MAG: hypothetical protein HUJ57_01850 [Erysipelotrichaceae bacterium]|nr:hypothetical protein [Erysipelotrichaceae bacterium]